MKNILSFITAFVLTLALGISSSIAQSKEAKSESKSKSSLQGLTEAVLVNGQPTLRILSPKNGASEISYQKRDGEDALVFPVLHYHAFLYAQAPGEKGKLVVTKTRLVFDPVGNKDHYFNFARTEITKAEAQKSGRFGKNIGHHILIVARGEDSRYAVLFNDNAVVGFQGDYMMPATEYFERAFVNFDAALAEFQQLTASVRPEPDETDAPESDESEGIIDKYDRFKDLTIIRTPRLSLRNNKRSIRVHSEYSFSGKMAQKPATILLFFHAAAPRAVFREDELQLNFIVDDERVPAGKARIVEEEKVKTTVRQSVMISLPYETFAQIAKAKKVELQIGDLEYKLTDSHLRTFNELYARSMQKGESK